MPRIPKRLLALGGLVAGGAGAMTALRKRRAGRPATPAPSAAAAPAQPPTPAAAAGPAAESVPIAPPPVETPGPSVTAPADPGSSTESEERADAATPDGEVMARQAGGPVDELVERETAAAAAEAGGIGGHRPEEGVPEDPAMAPVYEAGGGEAEGFEQAEADLVENASHGGGRGNPTRDAFTPEVESDEATGISAEGDQEKVSEVVEEAPEAETTSAAEAEAEAAEDPGSGPGVTHERQ
ncbi:MAG TPA: hypothetical protein VFT50_05130 [Baekduia sp.]|nr:hypothetical protein [Baekduia sp.]